MKEDQRTDEVASIFQNEDILSIIASFLSYAQPDSGLEVRERRRDLLAALLTCKAFFNPATAVLWKELDSIMPLLKLIPSFVFVNGCYTMNDAFTQEDIQTVNLYSKHVRTLRLDTLDVEIKSHVIHRFTNLRTSLLPNLETLIISSLLRKRFFGSSVELAYTDTAFLALSPSLKKLSLQHVPPNSEAVVISYLSVLEQKRADLKMVYLAGNITSQTLSLLTQFRGLKQVSVTINTSLTPSILRIMADLPVLTHLLVLGVRVAPATDSSVNEQTDQSLVKFPMLERLRLGGEVLENLNLLRSLERSKTITDIELTMSCQWTLGDATVYSDILVTCIKESMRIASVLKRFILRMPDLGPTQTVTLPADAVLTYFTSCHNICQLEFDGIYLSIDDDNILTICNSGAWKNLKLLKLPSSPEDDSPSLYSLSTIARHCPRLTRLQICVDFRLLQDYHSLKREWEAPQKKHGLEHLVLIKPPSDNTLRNATGADALIMSISIARYIEHYFPSLPTVILRTHYPVDNDWWRGVCALYAEFQAIKAQTLAQHNSLIVP